MLSPRHQQQARSLFVDVPVAEVEAVIELAWIERRQLKERDGQEVSPALRAAAAGTYTGRFAHATVEDYIAGLPRAVQRGLLALMIFGREPNATSVKELAVIKQWSPGLRRAGAIAQYLASKSKLGENLEFAMKQLIL